MTEISRRSFVGVAAAAGGAWMLPRAMALGNPAKGWHRATVYQVYPASFCDSNGDGVGDIPGIISRLDHLHDLGIGFIWLSPVYASPMVDNGYDISDYQDINPLFGTLADMDKLVAEARSRGIGILMDLVVNHTSEEHQWFKAARQDKGSPLRDYYIWRDPKADGSPPNGLQSAFGGSAWTLDQHSGQYYLHLFASAQPDLNWTHPALRQAVYRMMNWWLDRGVAGFRMDVTSLIGKDIDHEVTDNGPMLHPYLREMHEATQKGRDCVTVGEAWGATPQDAIQYSADSSHELSMIFQFEHVQKFWDEKLGKWQPKPIDLVTLKAVFEKWQLALAEKGWNSLFWGNHDLPRAVSRYGNDGEYRVASARMLATVLHLMKGTPYVYQGEEIGMTNAGFRSIDQYRDVETLNFYKLQRAAGRPEEEFLAGARANSRDNARTPMQWSAGPGAGFTTGKPWLGINENNSRVNAAADRADPEGVFRRYQQLIQLRKQSELVREGSFKLLFPQHPDMFVYQRELAGAKLTVLANFTGRTTRLGVGSHDTVESVAGRDVFNGRHHVVTAESTFLPYQVLALMP
jgi:oligo-1,6-glucosidase